MRFNNIFIENLTSFYGEHFIDFNQCFFNGPILVITGPTGAGKSSILTAISLALYGKTHKTALTQSDFISSGTDKAEIKLEFSIGKNTFNATWLCRIKKK